MVPAVEEVCSWSPEGTAGLCTGAPRHFSWQEAQSDLSCRLPSTTLPSLRAFVPILPLPGDLAEAWATFKGNDSGAELPVQTPALTASS